MRGCAANGCHGAHSHSRHGACTLARRTHCGIQREIQRIRRRRSLPVGCAGRLTRRSGVTALLA